MASRMARTKGRRRLSERRRGKRRKRKEQNKGTTPKFAIHKDE